MKTYAQIQKKASHCIEGRKDGLQMKNSSVIGQRQAKLMHSIQGNTVRSGGEVVQAYQVATDKIEADIKNPGLEERVFSGTTKTWIENNVIKRKEDNSLEKSGDEYAIEEGRVEANRNQIQFANLGNSYLGTSEAINTWLTDTSNLEHIYLYTGGQLYGSISGNDTRSNKKPHPTILGCAADHEVDYAGIITREGRGYTINGSSGHYRPTNGGDTLNGAATKLKGIVGKDNVTVVQ